MKLKKNVIALGLAFSMVVSGVATGMPMQVNAAQDKTGFVTTDGTNFTLDGSDFYYAGTNNYYINFKPSEDVDEVMQDAEDMGLTVIRTWGHLDVGTMTDQVGSDGFPTFSNNVDGVGHKEGVYYQYFDAEKGEPEVNHGEDGLQKLDYVIAQAEKHNIKVILTLTNYWDAFGGMGQYCLWAGKNKSDVEDFYSDETIKGWFKDYIYDVLNHENVYTGRKLMDEPAIFAWELSNEPRYNAQDKSKEENEMYAWASEMSAYIKSIDKNHMVAVGDEGGMYYNEYVSDHPGSQAVPGVEGLNTQKHHWHGGMGNYHYLVDIDTIDFGTVHLYPGAWGMDSELELSAWLQLHADVAHDAGKPVILEEFGWSSRENADKVTPYAAGRDTFFEYIYDAIIDFDYAGTNFWMLGAHTVNDAAGYYPDYDGFTVYNFQGPISADNLDHYGTNEIIKEHAAVMNSRGDRNKISVSKLSYDKSNPSECMATISPQTGATISSVAMDGKAVAEGTAYDVSGNDITFKADYLESLDEGTYYVTITMTVGSALELTLEVLDSSIESAVVGNGSFTFDKNVKASKDVVIPFTANDGGACKGVYVVEANTKTALNANAYTVNENSITIKASALQDKAVGDLTVILDFEKGSDPIVIITINDTTGKDIVDNFEGYASNTELNAAWTRNTNGGTVSGSLVTGQSNSTAMEYSFNLGSAGYAGVTKSTSGLAVTDFDGISFWIKAENTTKNDITIQLREKVSDYNSIYWEKTFTWSELKATNGKTIEIPFDEFEPKESSYSGIVQPEAGQVCGENAIAECSIYVGGTESNNSFVIDDITLYNEDGSDVEDEEESTEEETTEEETTEEESSEEETTEVESTEEESTEEESSEVESTEEESSEEESSEIESSDATETAGAVEVEYVVRDSWNSGYNAEFVVTNNTDDTLTNWKLSFDWDSEIAAVHTGDLKKVDDDSYEIGCMTWNSEIKSGESVSIQFQGADTQYNSAMTNMVFTADNYKYDISANKPVDGDNSKEDGNVGSDTEKDDTTDKEESTESTIPGGDISMQKVVTSEWGTGYTVEIVVTNNTDSTLKNWEISFDWASKIGAVYTGILKADGNSYTIQCPTWKTELAPGETVTLYIQGADTKCNEQMTNVVFTADNFSSDL